MTSPETSQPITYATAGVDTEAGDRAVELMKAAVSATHNAQVVGGFGGFAGLFEASEFKNYDRPLLTTSTDGVGTKVAIAQALDIHHTIGHDLVGMVVDDIVVVGAKPLFMTDYIACGKVVPQRIADIVRGIAEAAALTGTALVGGETAEHPGLLGPEDYDVAGAVTGVVEESKILGAHRVASGDVIIAIPSSGLHSNGYSLVRAVVAQSGWALEREVAEFGRTLGEELLEPTRLYTKVCLDLAAELDTELHAYSHITGGGLAANLARVLPQGSVGTVARDSWQLPPVFQVVADLGKVPYSDLERTLNLGVGMVAVVAAAAADRALAFLAAAGFPSWVIGQVSDDDALAASGASVSAVDLVQGAKGVDGGSVLLTGQYRR